MGGGGFCSVVLRLLLGLVELRARRGLRRRLVGWVAGLGCLASSCCFVSLRSGGGGGGRQWLIASSVSLWVGLCAVCDGPWRAPRRTALPRSEGRAAGRGLVCGRRCARLGAGPCCLVSMRCRAASSRCVVSLFAALPRCSVSLLWLGASSRLLAHQPSHAEEGFRRRCCSRCRRRRFRGRVVAVRVGFVLVREGVAAIWLSRAVHGRR